MFSVGIFAASERACMNSWRGVSPSSAKMHERNDQVFGMSGWCAVLSLRSVRTRGMKPWLWLEVRDWVNNGQMYSGVFRSSKERLRYRSKINYVTAKQVNFPSIMTFQHHLTHLFQCRHISSIWIFAHGNLLCRSRDASVEDHE